MPERAPIFDLTAFWAENDLCRDRPFCIDKPRAPIEISIDDHWLLEEMQVPSTVQYFSDPTYRSETNRACNDRLEEQLGKRFFSESIDPPSILRLEEVMGSERHVVEGGTPWLEAGYLTIDALEAGIRDMENWSDDQLRSVIFSTRGIVTEVEPSNMGAKEIRRAGSRGPATQATSIVGTMNCLYWIMDYPEVMGKFFELLADIIIRYHRIVEVDSGVEYQGYYWLDDNCALYSPDLYEEFCYPALKRVTDTFAPELGHYRYQHSDSEMRHLLPILSRIGFHGVNFGPTLPAELIRHHMPHAVIHGEVAPNTLRDKPLDAVVAEVRRDFDAVGGDGGLVVTTCGSVSAGTTIESIRGFMWAVHEYCRYG